MELLLCCVPSEANLGYGRHLHHNLAEKTDGGEGFSAWQQPGKCLLSLLYLPKSPVRLFFCSVGTCAAVGVAAVEIIKNARRGGVAESPRTAIWPEIVLWRNHPAVLVFMPTVYTGNTRGVRQSMPLSLLMRLLRIYWALVA